MKNGKKDRPRSAVADELRGLEGAAPPAEAAAAAPAAVAEPPKGKRKSGAAYRKEKREREQARGGGGVGPGGAALRPAPRLADVPDRRPAAGGDGAGRAAPDAPKPAAETDPAALAEARRVIADPATLEFIEGLYRFPYEAWAEAVKVPGIVPTPPKVERAAKLIVQVMKLVGPKEWMRWLPAIFLVMAIGEDVVHGVQAQRAKKEEDAQLLRGGARPPVPPPPPPPPAPAPAPPPAAVVMAPIQIPDGKPPAGAPPVITAGGKEAA